MKNWIECRLMILLMAPAILIGAAAALFVRGYSVGNILVHRWVERVTK